MPTHNSSPFLWGSANVSGVVNFSKFAPWAHPQYFPTHHTTGGGSGDVGGVPQQFPSAFTPRTPPTDAREFLAGSLPEPSTRRTPTVSTSVTSSPGADGSNQPTNGRRSHHHSHHSNHAATNTKNVPASTGRPKTSHYTQGNSNKVGTGQEKHAHFPIYGTCTAPHPAPAPQPAPIPNTGSSTGQRKCATCKLGKQLVDVQGVGILCENCLYAHTGAEYHRLTHHGVHGSRRNGSN